MKQNILALAGFLTIPLIASANAENHICKPVPNISTLRSGDTINGPAVCTEGVSKLSRVNGPVYATNTVFKNNLTVNGPIKLDKVQAQNLLIRGPLLAFDSQIGNLQISSNIVSFNNTQIKDIIIHQSANEASTLRLLGNSSVGKVTFTGKRKGVINVAPTAQINSNVTNGIVKTISP